MQNKVFKNFSYLTLGSIVSQVLMLVTVIKITNELTSDAYGTYSFIVAQGMLLITVGELGTKAIIIRSIARNPENTMDLVVNGTKLRIITFIVTLVAYLGYNELLGSLTMLQIGLLAFYVIVNSIFYLFEHVFLGHQKMYYPSIIKSFISFLYFAVVFLIPESLFSVEVLVFSYVCLHVIQTSLFYYLLKREDLLIGKAGNFIESSKTLVLESWPYMALMFLTLPMLHMANNFLDINSTKDEVGYFNLAKKLMGPVQLVISFSLTAIFPNISAMFINDNKRFKNLIYQGFHIFIGLTAFAAFSFTLFSEDIVLFIFSDKYIPATTVIQLQVWYVFLNGVNYFITVVLGASNLEKEIYKFAIVNLLISAPFLYFGSLYGAIGISYGFVISFAIFGVYLWYRFRKLVEIRIKHEIKTWVISLILFLLSYFVMHDFNLFYKILCFIPISAGLLGFIYFSFKKIKILN